MKTKTDKKNAISLKELARRALVVLLTVSMVTMNSPLAYAAESMGEERVNSVTSEPKTVATPVQAPAQQTVPADTSALTPTVENNGATTEAAPVNAEQTAPADSAPVIEVMGTNTALPEGEQEVRLSFENAYIYYKGQAVASPMSSVKVAAGENFEFAATADDGYKLDVVKATTNGAENVLTPNASGLYAVPAADVAKGLVVSVTAKADPLATSNTSTRPIEEKRNEKSQFVFEDDSVKVTATLTDPASLPADVTFKVTPITRDSKDAQGNRTYNYDAYMEAANKGLREEDKFTEQNSLLYDVAFLTPKRDDQGKPVAGEFVEVQLLEGQVDLDFQFKKDQLKRNAEAEGSSEVVIKHLPLRDSVRASAETTADAANITAADVVVEQPADQGANVAAEQAHLRLDNLSAMLFAASGASAKNAAPVTAPANNAAPDATSGATGQGSDAQNGGATTDPASTQNVAPASNTVPTSTNLADFLKSATFDAPQNDQGVYVVRPGESYKFTLTFAERYGDNTLQFPNGAATDLTYQLPAGLDVANGHDGSFTIKIREGSETHSITGNTYSINNGVLTVRLNTGHPLFSKVAAAPNVQFTVSFEGKLVQDSGKLLFEGGIEKDIQVDNKNSVVVSKVARQSQSSDKMEYEVSVRSNGHSENVKVKDAITSPIDGLLTLSANEGWKITSSKTDHDLSSISKTITGNQFELTIPSMSDGEVITIKYQADIDPLKIPNVDGKYVTAGNNKVEAWSDGDPTHKIKDIETRIDYTPTIAKPNGEVTSINGNKQTISWSIKANERCAISMAGTTITDTIDSGSQKYMKYSGDGLTIEVKDKQDNVVRTDHVAWSQLENKTDSTWSYKVPASDSGNAYKYYITYTTEADVTGETSDVTVKNKVETPGGGSSTGTAGIGVPDNGVAVHKQVTNVDIENKRVSWKVTFNVPVEGLSKAEVTDIWPSAWIANINHLEPVIADSVQVVGLVQPESYTVTNEKVKNNQDATVIRFFKDAAHAEQGLTATGSDRMFVVTLDTVINDEWFERSATKKDLQTHSNSIELNADGYVKTSIAETQVAPEYMEKKGSPYGTRNVDGVDVPVYKYEVVISNIESDHIEIEDTFDKELLEIYDGTQWNTIWDARSVFGGNAYSQDTQGQQRFNVVETGNGIKLVADSSCIPRDTSEESANGFYSYYRLVYYLAVKDGAAWQKIKNRAAASDDGKYNIHNSISYEGKTTGTDVTYEYEGLKKEILTSDEQLKKTDEDIWAQFRLTLNEGAMMLNGGEPLTVTDTVENLSVDVTRIEANPSDGVIWDMSGNTVTYTIPDSTKVVITYWARVTMSELAAVGSTQQIAFSNHAQMKGYSKTINKVAERKNEGSGSGSLASIKLKKYEAGDMTHTLAGAKFQLQDANENPVLGQNGQPVEFVTGADGMITINGTLENNGWALQEDTQYYLEELEAPQNYKLAGHKFQFKVSSDGTSDYDNYIYYAGDTMTAKNYRGTDVRVLKEWSDGNEHHDADSVVVKLQQKIGESGTWSDTIRREVKNGDVTTWQDVTGPTTLTLNKDNQWKGVFSDLPLAVPNDPNNPDGNDTQVTYRVVETQVNGQAVDEGTHVGEGGLSENSGTYVFTVHNSVSNGALKVTKTVAQGTAQDNNTDFEFTVTLAGDQASQVNGTYGTGDTAMTFTNGVANFTLKNGWEKVATNLPAGLTYTVVETNNDDFTATHTGNTGTISTTTESVAAFTNTRKQYGDLEVSKTVTPAALANNTDEFSFTVTLTGDGASQVNGTYGTGDTAMTFENGVATFKLKAGEKKVATRLPAGITYTVQESAHDRYTTNNATGTGTVPANGKAEVVIANTRKTGDLEVTKTVASERSADTSVEFNFTVTLSDTTINGTYGGMTFENGVATFKLKGGENKVATGLPTGITYTVTETQAAGFTTEKNGDEGTISTAKSTAAFTNTRETGELEVTKTVASGRTADTNVEFDFTVTLTDNPISGTYGEMTFTDGVANFKLKGGESKKATGLPTDITYTVTETQAAGFDTEKTGDTGTISTTKSTAAFTNTRKTGELEVTKTVVSDKAGDTDVEFEFTVTLAGAPISGTFGEMTFTDGVATFKLKTGEKKTATGLPTDVSYTVVETENGDFTTTMTGNTDTISTTKSTAAFTNTRKQGGLIVSKTVKSDLATDTGKEFDFTVTLSDTTINGTYGEKGMTFTNGVATFKLKAGENKTATGLPTGITYTVEETADDGFVTTYNGETGQLTDAAEPAHATVTNTRKTGDLEVTKTVTSDKAGDTTKGFGFTVTLSDTTINGTYGGMTFENGVATFTLKHNQKKTATGLPTDVTYTVTETAADGFTTEKTGDTGTISTTKSTAAFTNTRETGDLEVTKTVTSTKPADTTKDFDFTVTLSDTTIGGTYGGMTFTGGVATFKLKDGENKTAAGLPTGITYTVTETPADGFTTEKNGDEGTISTTKSTAAFTNTRNTGALEVKKTVVSSTNADKQTNFTFTINIHDEAFQGTYDGVTFTKGVATITLKDGQTKRISGLPTDLDYTVTEANAEGFVTTRTGNTGTITTADSKAEFTNTKEEGGLQVHKSVTSPSASDHDKMFGFTVTLADTTVNGTYGEMTFTNGVATFELKDGGTKTATGLAKGLGYTVTEATDDNFQTTSTGATGTIPTGDTPVIAEFANARKTGGFNISKQVVSDAAADKTREYTFTVSLSDKSISGKFGDMTFNEGEATVTLVGNQTKSATGLPIGITYTAVETAVNGMAADAQTKSGAVAEDAPTTTFTNTRDKGNLKVKKTVVSDLATDANVDFSFTVTLTDTTINGTYGEGGMTFTNGVATFTLKAGEEKVAIGLPTEIGYTVVEAANNGFTTTNTGSTGTIATRESTAEFTNTRKTGDLEVSKTVSSDLAADATKDFTFTVTLSDTTINGTYGEMTFTDGVATFTLKNGGTKKATGLPTDLGYTVTETADDGFVTTPQQPIKGTITATTPTAAFTNTRKQGGLMVTKTVASDLAADATRDFTFTVTLSDTTINGTYGDMTFENGVATFTLKKDGSMTATGLPTGITYTVEETADDDFTTTYTGETGQLTNSVEPAHATVTNTRKTGGLKVKKELVSDRAADASQVFTFTVTLGDSTISGDYGGMHFDNGEATVTITGAGEVVATGLPTDLGYTVAETDVKGFELTGKTGDKGTISTTESTATFTNTRKKGDLEVTKTVNSVLAGDAEADFNFTVTLTNNPISGTYGDMTFEKGVAHFTLRNGQTKTATGLPTDVRYTVEETPATGFETTKTGDEGTISTAKSTAAFTNRRQVGSLKINKTVLVDNKGTNTTVADGTYTFRIQGPGAYSGEGQTRSITITNGTAADLVMQNMPIGTYTITELTNGLPSNMHLMSTSPQTVTVTDGDTAGVPTAAFTNNLTSTSAHMEATKTFANWDDSNTSEFTFELTPVNGAPMPNGVAAQAIAVTKDAPKATFGDISYTEEGTYSYKILETVPSDASNGKYQGVQYDTQAHDVTVVVAPAANGNGDLEARVTYDENAQSLTITNTYTANGSTHLTASKELTGRPFAEGDTWTFKVVPTGANAQTAPKPEHEEVTIKANESADIDFGNITYGLEHAGKTYEYQITETGNVANVENDVAKTVTVTVTNNGDGTLEVKSSADENPVTFTNKYQRKVDLVATKGLEGRTEWKQGEEYNFELNPENEWSGEKADQSGVSRDAVTRGDRHEAKFGTFVFTSADKDRYFSYDVREVVPAEAAFDAESGDYVLNGVHYNNYLYTVQYHVKLENNELKVDTSYSRGEEKLEGINVVNTYAPKSTTARVEAKKIVSGRRANTDDEFTFDLLLETKENVRQLVQTQTTSRAATDTYNSETNTDTLSVVFDNVPCTVGGKTADAPHVATYIIKEHIPKGAVEKTAADGTKTYVLDGVTYDATELRVTISTYDDQNGQLHATVNYENDQQPVFTNKYFGAQANISFDKEFYGANLNEGAFDFTMRATDDQYNVREGTAVVHRDGFVDDGGAHTVKMTNGAFAGNVAKVSVPTITYYEPGEYYYEISEDPKDSVNGVTNDAATIRAKVTVDENAKATTEYWLYDGTTATKTTAPTLYNNGLITMSMRSAALRAMSDATSATSFVPAVHKILKNGVLRSGEFSFAMYEGSDTNGRLLQTASNDTNGAIAFDAIEYKPADIGKTFTYTIVENNTGDQTIAYDTDVIRLTVTVGRGSDGEVKVDANYAKFNVDGTPDTNSPDTFINAYDTIVIHAVKRSREEPYDPLPGAHYGLWMVNPDGEDVYMGLGRNQQQREGSELVSSDNGDLYYDIPLLEGVAYYFLEEWPPPEGHLVDPYPTDYFTLVHDKENGRFRLVYEADADFAKYCPGVTR